MRFPSSVRWSNVPRRWRWVGGIVLGTLLLVALTLGVIYPRVGAYMIKKKVGAKVAQKLGRQIQFGTIDVSLGHAVLNDVEIRGPLDGETPLVHVDRIDVDFDTWASLVGKVEVGEATLAGLRVTLRRDAFGRDNVRDILDRVRGGGETHAKRQDFGSLRPKKITVTSLVVLADDAITGATAMVDGGDATWTPMQVIAHARNVTATTPSAPKASVKSIEIRKMDGMPPIVTIDGGDITLWKKMSLSGIAGSVVADPDKHGRYTLDFAGGYGNVPGKLWTAKGGFEPAAETAQLDLVAEKFQLSRLAPILASSAIVDYGATSIDTQLHVSIDKAGAKFSGDLNLTGLNVGHPMIAEKEVRDLDLSAVVAGSYDRTTRTLNLTRGDFIARDVPFSVTGTILNPRHEIVIPESAQADKDADDDDDDDAKPAVPMRGPYGIQVLKLRMVIPPINCQKMLDAIPAEMAPYMQGYKMKGMFDVDVKLEIDWTHLDDTVLGGHVGINHCRVVDEPADSPKRLENQFEHYVEYEKGEWLSFIVGPENPDFVPYDQISPNLIKSITTTEDGAFFKHHGFITSEFRTALVRDLQARRFRNGASSITMQMVKNVLLYREKTLARKLQELFLTWHVENTLTKERILEIYFNVIEYGPQLYGIGPAAQQFFGKPAKDLTPTEAAFFSSILPNPKARYKQYCQGTLTKWTQGKIERILGLMLKREKITQEEYDKAIATPLVFVKDGSETEAECMKRVKEAIKNARPTAPPKKE